MRRAIGAVFTMFSFFCCWCNSAKLTSVCIIKVSDGRLAGIKHFDLRMLDNYNCNIISDLV